MHPRPRLPKPTVRLKFSVAFRDCVDTWLHAAALMESRKLSVILAATPEKPKAGLPEFSDPLIRTMKISFIIQHGKLR